MQRLGVRLTRILGRSMQPRLQPGAYALFGPFRTLRVGDIVLVEHPRYGRIVKAIHRIDTQNLELIGLSEDSTPTQDLGQVSVDAVLGRLIFSIQPPIKPARSGHTSHLMNTGITIRNE